MAKTAACGDFKNFLKAYDDITKILNYNIIIVTLYITINIILLSSLVSSLVSPLISSLVSSLNYIIKGSLHIIKDHINRIIWRQSTQKKL